nr:MAG TPA: hypothetical protein [Caudoviricetes sp.]
MAYLRGFRALFMLITSNRKNLFPLALSFA